MAWEIKEIGLRSGRFSLDGYAREYKRTLQVLTDSATLTALEVAVGAGVAWGDEFPDDPGAIVVDIDATQPEPRIQPKLWHIEATYRTATSDPSKQQGANPGGGGGGGGGGSPGAPQDTNPLHVPPVITWGSRSLMVPIDRAWSGTYPTNVPTAPGEIDATVYAFANDQTKLRPVRNSAGSEFALQQREIKLTTLRVVRNEVYFDPFEWEIYKGAVNRDTFQGQPQGCWICDDLIANINAFSNNVSFAQVTYDFTCAPDSDPTFWWLKLVDQGPKYIVEPLSSGKRVVEYTMPTGGVFESALLNGVNGGLLDGFNASTGILEATARPAIKNFLYRRYLNFSLLEIPDPAY